MLGGIRIFCHFCFIEASMNGSCTVNLFQALKNFS